jgi:hypothetical protein
MSLLNLPTDLLNIVNGYFTPPEKHTALFKEIRSYGVFRECLTHEYHARYNIPNKNTRMAFVWAYAHYTEYGFSPNLERVH